jgi:excisionase family DNA binding protein
MAQKDDKILGVEELMKFFGVSDQTIWRWCKSGKLPGFKIGSQWKVRQSDLNRIINRKLKNNGPGSGDSAALF